MILFGSVQPLWPFCPVKAQERKQVFGDWQGFSAKNAGRGRGAIRVIGFFW
jgi:hypothetical protein